MAVAKKQERLAAAKLQHEQVKTRKLHVIAERRAKSHGMSKAEFIGQIVKKKYLPITAADLAAEPDPGAPKEAE